VSKWAKWVRGWLGDLVILSNTFSIKQYLRKYNRSEVETLHIDTVWWEADVHRYSCAKRYSACRYTTVAHDVPLYHVPLWTTNKLCGRLMPIGRAENRYSERRYSMADSTEGTIVSSQRCAEDPSDERTTKTHPGVLCLQQGVAHRPPHTYIWHCLTR